MANTSTRGILLTMLSAVTFGFAFTLGPMTYGEAGSNPVTLTFLRNFLSLPVLLAILWYQGISLQVSAKELKNSVADEADQEPKTVAFFYITSNGQANVRKSADYLPKMIELAGGRYIFDSLGDEDDATSTMSMQMEEFYAGAKDADYIIYNSTIEGELSSVDDLLAKSPLFEKFKAVQEGHVYCTSKNLYQSTMSLGTITSDIRRMLTGDDADLTYIYKLE